jgi:hypothetical protein
VFEWRRYFCFKKLRLMDTVYVLYIPFLCNIDDRIDLGQIKRPTSTKTINVKSETKFES